MFLKADSLKKVTLRILGRREGRDGLTLHNYGHCLGSGSTRIRIEKGRTDPHGKIRIRAVPEDLEK